MLDVQFDVESRINWTCLIIINQQPSRKELQFISVSILFNGGGYLSLIEIMYSSSTPKCVGKQLSDSVQWCDLHRMHITHYICITLHPCIMTWHDDEMMMISLECLSMYDVFTWNGLSILYQCNICSDDNWTTHKWYRTQLISICTENFIDRWLYRRAIPQSYQRDFNHFPADDKKNGLISL